nr:hypothetical protein [uncultured Gellertiella sp.]
MNSQRVIVLLAAAALLSACDTTGNTPRRLPDPVRAPTVEGSWGDPHGLVSTFQAGTFNTRTSDGTNAVMASGTYTTDPSGIVQITFYSTIKKTTSRANCQLASLTQLNCTSDSGAQFSLQRRADMPSPPPPPGIQPVGQVYGTAPAPQPIGTVN